MLGIFARRRREAAGPLAVAAPAAAGVLPGLALAYAAGRSLQGLLAGIEPGDLPTFTVASLPCLLMALSGSLAPALRAVRVDPITVVRTD